jgi:hypothetical protein
MDYSPELQAKIDVAVKKYQDMCEEAFKTTPEEYHKYLISLDKKLTIKYDFEEAIVFVPTVYFMVNGRIKWANDYHVKHDAKYLFLIYPNMSNVSETSKVTIPLWAMPGPAARVHIGEGVIAEKELELNVVTPAMSITAIFASSLHGIVNDTVEIQNKDFAVEDAVTSVRGRVLGTLGYGITPQGFASLEEAVNFFTGKPTEKKISIPSTSTPSTDPKEEDYRKMSKSELVKLTKELRISLGISSEDMVSLCKKVKGIPENEELVAAKLTKEDYVGIYAELLTKVN